MHIGKFLYYLMLKTRNARCREIPHAIEIGFKYLLTFGHGTGGNIAVMFALVAPAAIFAVGLGLDTYDLQSTKIALNQTLGLTCDHIRSTGALDGVATVASQGQQFASSQAITELQGAVFDVTTGLAANGAPTYTVNGTQNVPVYFVGVLGFPNLVTINQSTACNSPPVVSACSSGTPAALWTASGAGGVTLRASSNTVTQGVTSTTLSPLNSQGYGVLLVSASDGSLQSQSFVAPNQTYTAPNVSSADGDNIYIQSVNQDGSLPAVCLPPQPSTPPAPTPTPPAPAVTPACSTMNGGTRPNSSNVTNSGWDPGTVGLQESPAALTANFSDNLGAYTFPIASWYTANTAPVNFTGKTKTTTITMEQSYMTVMRNKNSAHLAALVNAGYYLAWVRASTEAVWTDGKGSCSTESSPIVFDLINLGHIETTGISTAKEAVRTTHGREIFFDMFGSKTKIPTEWLVGNGQALLVDNRDGHAADDMNGRRLFGDVDGFADGYSKLATFSKSHARVLRNGDLDGLALWIDNGDGIVQPGELNSLQQLHVTEIDTQPHKVRDDNGDMLLRSTAIVAGRKIMTEDVWFGESGQ